MQKLILVAASTILMGLFLYTSMQNSTKQNLLDTHFSSMAKEINANKNLGWVANEEYVPFSRAELKKMFNIRRSKTLPSGFSQAPKIDLSDDDLPESFSGEEKWSNCESFKEVRDQSACGSCWAVAAASALSDRLCVANEQKSQKRISSLDLLACCDACGDGCNGGELFESFHYAKEKGLVTGGEFGDKNSCKPYPFPPCNHHSSGPYDDCSQHDYSTPECTATCVENYPVPYKSDKIFLKQAYSVRGEKQIMKDLMTYGSLEVAFDVYEDFMLYKSGIYSHTSDNLLGGHAVKLVGWGIENGIKYWVCVNNWNSNWGEKGAFRIKRGVDECGIEDDVVGGLF